MSPSKRRTPGDGGLFKRADGMWTGSVEIRSDDGKRRQKRVYSKNRNEAKRKLEELRDEIKRGIVPIASTTTVANWLRYWADEIKKPKVRPNTYDYYDEAIRLHITPHLDPKLKLKQLTTQHVRDMLKKVNTSANAQRAHKTLKFALKDAIKNGYLTRNVAEAVDTPGHTKRTRGSLGADAAKRAIRAAIDIQTSSDETTPMLATRWAAAFLTGARPAELLGLEWDRVDLDNGVFDLSWQLQQLDRAHGCGEPIGTDTNRKPLYPCGKKRASFCPQARWDFNNDFIYRDCIGSFVWTKPKTAAGTRIVPIVAPLLIALAEHRELTAGQPNPHGLVWHRRDGRPLSRHDDAAAWRQVLDAAELPAVEVYATRHSAATLLQELGVPEEVRMQITGHSSAAAHRGYIHVDQTQTRAALGKLERLLLPADDA
ncbi:tyrosine-type recombinase/integrase [Mycobacterium asiaticum]|uniref:Integrase n=1 Tax=Mycobacterium asiaticum TaxID=1790 RepID=A0A1A3NQD4_MYCAS|nr:site-specific integrase [Mycobacterium asiaticum]OBK22512.1 integrase [Mycobacterium asiaticum]